MYLVLTNGIKVFVPASQSGVPRDGDLSTLVDKHAEVGDGLDNAGVDLAHFHLFPELLGTW